MSIIRILAGLAIVAVVLLATAWLIAANELWSGAANLTVPWLCSALALALLVVGAASCLSQQPPSTIPPKTAASVCVATILVLGVGIVVDWSSYCALEQPAQWALQNLTASAAEWLGFSIMLAVMFWAPRTREK